MNTRGELVGINSQILSPSGGNIGIGFSIPANMARNVMTQLIEHGEVRRGMLGVTIQAVTSDLARSLGLTRCAARSSTTSQPGSPADKAGVQRGDVITAVNGAAVKDSNVLRNGRAAGARQQREADRDARRQGAGAERDAGERKADSERGRGAAAQGASARPGSACRSSR